MQVDYVAADNRSGSSTVTLDVPTVGSRASGTGRVPECADGCAITGLRVGRNTDSVFDDSEFVVLLEQAELGGLDLLDQTWNPDPSSLETAANDRFTRFDASRTFVVNRPDGLEVTLLASTPLALLLDEVSQPVPVLVADEDEPLALDLSGDDRVAQVVGEATTLPLLGSVGVLSDLRTAAVGSGPTVPSAEVSIVAAEGTPQALLDQVEEATGSSWRSLDDVRTSLGQAHGGAQARAYALTALACALVALLALGAGVARHLRDYRRDVASLRVLGIGLGTARRAGRAEIVTLTVLVAGAAVAGGWLAVTLLLGGLPLLVAAGRRAAARHRCPGVAPARPGGAGCSRCRGGRRSRPRGALHHHPTQPAARGGGPMSSPHDVLLLRNQALPRTTP